jgi:antitoxin (DNA-binding transcriptional repressor) of toxin-antitoxin stability system
MFSSMTRIAITNFKKRWREVIDDLEPGGVTITRWGIAIARLVPIASPSADLIGLMRGKIEIKGPILGSGLKWEASAGGSFR